MNYEHILCIKENIKKRKTEKRESTLILLLIVFKTQKEKSVFTIKLHKSKLTRVILKVQINLLVVN